MKIRRYFAPDTEQGAPSAEAPAALTVESAVAALQDKRKTEAKAVDRKEQQRTARAARAETHPEEEPRNPERAEPGPNEEPAPETGDAPQEPSPELSDEEKIAAELEKEQTTAPDPKLPSGWSEADRETWNSLTPEAQAKLVEREKARDAGIRKRLQEADLAKKSADQLTEQLKAERQRITPLLQSQKNAIVQQLVRDYPEVNPQDPNSLVRFALEHPERKVGFDTLIDQLRRVDASEKQHDAQLKAQADAEQAKFEEGRVKRLLELDKTLSDEKISKTFESDVVGFLTNDNPYGKVEPERIKLYTAEELLMVRDAMKYRRALAGLKAKPKTEVPKVVRPGASGEGAKSEEISALGKRLKKSGKIEDGLALLRARRAAQA